MKSILRKRNSIHILSGCFGSLLKFRFDLVFERERMAAQVFQPSYSCTAEALNRTNVKGKTALCLPSSNKQRLLAPGQQFGNATSNVVAAGGAGLIFAQYADSSVDATDSCGGIPCVLVDIDTGYRIRRYVGAASSPVAKIEPARSVTGTELLAPKVAGFSSRGPSIDYADVIKPDIAAPGASILAAVGDSYMFMSGTSMATPHVAGIVALLKALHPDWSPAALKSAIVTTASVTDEHGMPILAEGLPKKTADPFDYGGGHINPNRAADPGLVYDIDPNDYSQFLRCSSSQTTSVSCNATSVPGYLLNLPSVSVPNLRYPVTVPRTVTNVGEVDAVYHVAIESPAGVKMEVEPPVLVFNAANQVQTFQIKLSPMLRLQGDYTFGSITWYNERRMVRIPVAARITIQDFFADV